jgi:hypothetical protein
MYRDDCPRFVKKDRIVQSAMDRLTKEQRAWAAGFFDGEGCVRVQVQYKYGKEKLPNMALTVDASGCDKRPVDLLYSWFNGSHRAFQNRSGGNLRKVYNWRVSGWPAYDFCRTVIDYSTVKHEQLKLAIEFYELPWRNRGGGPSIRRTHKQLSTDIKISETMATLKKRDGSTGNAIPLAFKDIGEN